MGSATLGAAYRHLRDLFGGGTVVGLGDGALLARYALDRDGAAFEALVARHGPMVWATCRAILRNEHDVEDAFQATFLVLARKAGSVRGGDALGGWLHRVAYRSAVQASIEAKRRRRKEAEAPAMAPPDPHRAGPIDDVVPILHEEVNRLPEAHRLPVVLCDLQGLTYEQAADQLRWTVPTLRCRLARARRRLRDRLTHRGVTAPAVAALLAWSASPASAVPVALARSAVAAATGGAASASAAALTHIILRGMLMTNLKMASTAALAALGLATAGVIAAGSGRPEDPKPATKPTAPPPAVATDAPPPASKPGEVIEIRGVVVAPDGRPVAGATVRTAYIDRGTHPIPEATSGPDGRFLLALPRSALKAPPLDRASIPWLVASAPGFAPGWSEGIFRADPPAEQTVRLVEPGPPIEGRVVDLEGRPVAGARVETERIWFDERGPLDPWLVRAREGGVHGIWRDLQSFPIRNAAVAGPDGRFRMDGPGRDRIADLLISGQDIATTNVYVMGRDAPELRTVDRSRMEPRPFLVHATRFQVAAAPSRAVRGEARDKDSGLPLAGLEIKGAVFDERSRLSAPGVEATTDAQGRYRLAGLPRAAAYRLFIEPAPGTPYLNATFKAPADSPGMEPAAFDIALKRGVLVRGRVVEKGTGKPASGGSLRVFTFADNPAIADYPGYRESYPSQDYIREDGRFEVVAPPGRNVLVVKGGINRYRGVVDVESIPGYEAQIRAFRTVPQIIPASDSHATVVVDLDPGADPAPMEFTVDPGRSLTIRAVDPEGRPVAGTSAQGIGELYPTAPYPQESSEIEIQALDPSKPRRVVIAHQARKLAGSAYLKGDESGPITVTLRPWGTVAGRIVDDEGRPRKGIRLTSAEGPYLKHPDEQGIIPGANWNGGLIVGDDGRFRAEGLVPGLKYAATATSGLVLGGKLFEGVTVAPGEARELGDLKVIPLPEGELQ